MKPYSFLLLLLSFAWAEKGAAQSTISGTSEYKELRIPNSNPNPTPNPTVSSSSCECIWKTPDPSRPGTGGASSNQPYTLNAPPKQELFLEAEVRCPFAIDQSHCRLFVNGSLYASKTGIGSLRPSGSSYWYSQTLNFSDEKPGAYELNLQIDKDGRREQLKSLYINYAPGKPKLYLLSVGVPSDLKYTKNDADTIVKLFKSQEGLLYEKVHVQGGKALTSKEETVRSNLVRMLDGIKQNPEISKQDVVLIYLSAHGSQVNGNFAINCQDAYQSTDAEGGVSYEGVITSSELINKFKSLQCKKILLVDACHSGTGAYKGSSDEMSKAIDAMNRIGEGWTVITSSGGEKSLEWDSWRLGSFTCAIAEALNGKLGRGKYLTWKDLYDYVSRRCPELNKSVGKEAQYPKFIRQDAKDMPFFYVKP